MTELEITRRQLLERAALGGAVLTIPGFLAACGGSSAKKAVSSTHTLAKTLRFANWPLYIDVNDKTKARPSLNQFQKKFGVHVNYTEEINDNAQFFGKIRGPLSRGQSVDRDIIVDRKSTRLNSSHRALSRMPSSA